MLFLTEYFICENSGKDHRSAAGPDSEVSVTAKAFGHDSVTSGRRGNV